MAEKSLKMGKTIVIDKGRMEVGFEERQIEFEVEWGAVELVAKLESVQQE